MRRLEDILGEATAVVEERILAVFERQRAEVGDISPHLAGIEFAYPADQAAFDKYEDHLHVLRTMRLHLVTLAHLAERQSSG